MNTTTTMLLTGTIVVVGRWADGKTLSPRIAVGVIVLALALSLMAQSNTKLANQFGILILLSATFGYAPPILKMLGYPVTK